MSKSNSRLGNKGAKTKLTFMEDTPPRAFGEAPSQVRTLAVPTNLETTFFTRIGSRVATLTAFYEHVAATQNKSSLPEPEIPPPPVPSEAVVYDSPKHIYGNK